MAFEAQMVPNREAKVLFRSRGPHKNSDKLAADTKNDIANQANEELLVSSYSRTLEAP